MTFRQEDTLLQFRARFWHGLEDMLQREFGYSADNAGFIIALAPHTGPTFGNVVKRWWKRLNLELPPSSKDRTMYELLPSF